VGCGVWGVGCGGDARDVTYSHGPGVTCLILYVFDSDFKLFMIANHNPQFIMGCPRPSIRYVYCVQVCS
jgi:hypothetical protein